MKTKAEFPYKKGGYAYTVSGSIVTKRLVTKASPTSDCLRLEGVYYPVHIRYVGRTAKEALIKKYLRDASNLSHGIRTIESRVKSLKGEMKTLARMEKKILKELKKG